ncbi:sugar ABC transporter permease [Isoptericola halotolerans]|uniref:carbohydrate ABC transporter permease n=1 Tax=Isoptericola halotolerans TaxID=300560 RepID=UPI003890BC77
MILPAVALMVAFYVVPTAQAVRMSFSDWGGIGEITFDGLGNYVDVLTGSQLYESLWITIVFASFSAFGRVAIATLLAAAISHGVRGSKFYRIIWFIPAVAPSAAVAVYWSTAFQPGVGTFNAVLGLFGLDDRTAFLADPATALFPIIFVDIWVGVGFAFLLILGSMEQVPVSVYEAARIDGASRVRQFFSMTLPLIRPVLVVVTILQLVWAFNNFTIVWGMTQGGPGSATTTLPVLVYREAFVEGDYGTATTVAVLSGIVLMVVGFFAMRFNQSEQK